MYWVPSASGLQKARRRWPGVCLDSAQCACTPAQHTNAAAIGVWPSATGRQLAHRYACFPPTHVGLSGSVPKMNRASWSTTCLIGRTKTGRREVGRAKTGRKRVADRERATHRVAAERSSGGNGGASTRLPLFSRRCFSRPLRTPATGQRTGSPFRLVVSCTPPCSHSLTCKLNGASHKWGAARLRTLAWTLGCHHSPQAAMLVL